MKVSVMGSRTILDRDKVFYHLDQLFLPCGGEYGEDICILSGGANGASELAREWAKINNKDFVLFEPYYLLDKDVFHDPKHFFIRNRQIIDNADVCVFFWDGESLGTKEAIAYASRKGKDVRLYEMKEEESDVA